MFLRSDSYNYFNTVVYFHCKTAEDIVLYVLLLLLILMTFLVIFIYFFREYCSFKFRSLHIFPFFLEIPTNLFLAFKYLASIRLSLPSVQDSFPFKFPTVLDNRIKRKRHSTHQKQKTCHLSLKAFLDQAEQQLPWSEQLLQSIQNGLAKLSFTSSHSTSFLEKKVIFVKKKKKDCSKRNVSSLQLGQCLVVCKSTGCKYKQEETSIASP